MDVLITGGGGRVGTAILDHLGEDHVFTLLDRDEPPDAYRDRDYVVADVIDYEAIRPAFEDRDAVVHLAEYPHTDATVDQLFGSMRGTANVLRAAREAGVGQLVYASSNHVQGMYEREHAPAVYDPAFDLTVDHTDPLRPDSFYGTGKAFGEALGRQYVEAFEDGPDQFHALRIASVRSPEYDHPYGDAERGVDEGRFDRGSDEYERQVARMSATWQSRRDIARLVDCCLAHDRPGFDAFYGVSDNEARWFDLTHASETVGYEPVDSADEWDGPPGRNA